MFAKLSSLFSIFKNFDKIKGAAQETYVAIVKTLALLQYSQSQLNDTKLGTLLQGHLPHTIEVLTKVKSIFETYGPYIGIVPLTEATAAVGETNIVQDVKDSSVKLDEHVN